MWSLLPIWRGLRRLLRSGCGRRPMAMQSAGAAPARRGRGSEGRARGWAVVGGDRGPERIGQRRARKDLSAEVLRRVERAARRKREAESEYEQAVVRAGRLGLAHQDVASAARVAHGTVRAILARTETVSARQAGPAASEAILEPAPDQHSAAAS